MDWPSQWLLSAKRETAAQIDHVAGALQALARVCCGDEHIYAQPDRCRGETPTDRSLNQPTTVTQSHRHIAPAVRGDGEVDVSPL